jgi:hypothetical protein
MKQSSLTINKNIDIKFIAHDAFLESMNDTSMKNKDNPILSTHYGPCNSRCRHVIIVLNIEQGPPHTSYILWAV